MTSFVDASYVIAVLLAEKIKQGIYIVSIEELLRYGYIAQRTVNEENLDVVFLIDKVRLYNELHNYSDYFCGIFNSDGQLTDIGLTSSKDIYDLQNYFIAYLPEYLKKILTEIAKLIIKSDN